MLTKSELTRIFIFLHLIGIAILVLAFFLLIPPEARSHSAWLDLLVVCLVLSINFPPFALVQLSVGLFDIKIPAIGLLGVSATTYSTLALGLVLFGFLYHLPFQLQLVAQLGLIFALATVVSIAWWAAAHAVEVAEEERETRSALEGLKALIARCEMELSVKAPTRNREHQLLLALKEDARFLSPSLDTLAISYEQQMFALLEEIRLRLQEGATSLTTRPLDEDFEKCVALMALRKQIVIR